MASAKKGGKPDTAAIAFSVMDKLKKVRRRRASAQLLAPRPELSLLLSLSRARAPSRSLQARPLSSFCAPRPRSRLPRAPSPPPPSSPSPSPSPTTIAVPLPLPSAATIAAAAARLPPQLYFEKILPLEQMYNFGDFASPTFTNSDFDAKPMVLLLGQYSVGKTSFIRYLIGRDFPGARIGPEPTTDRFNAVMAASDDRIVPGNALAVDKDMPFSSLTRFGTEFLNKFQASMCPSPVLDKVYFVDSPGVLSGEKQKLGRAYDFVQVTEWFAQRADLILLLFDAHKLDISDEFQGVIKSLKGQDDKIRVVLNKADKVSSQSLMRVYGAMMWSLGKVVNTPEVMRVYIGSFWDGPCQNLDMEKFFLAEQSDLLHDLHDLPRNAAIRKVNELVKRARMAKVHALVVGHLKSQMPSLFGHAAKQAELIGDMANQFFQVMKKHRLPQGDFPNLARFQDVAKTFDFNKWKKLDERLMVNADDALSGGIPALLKQLAEENDMRAAKEKTAAAELMGDAFGAGPAEGAGAEGDPAAGGAATTAAGAGPANPFGGIGMGGKDAYSQWAANVNKQESDSVFKMLPGGQEGLVSGAGARNVLLESGVDTAVLRAIWCVRARAAELAQRTG